MSDLEEMAEELALAAESIVHPRAHTAEPGNIAPTYLTARLAEEGLNAPSVAKLAGVTRQYTYRVMNGIRPMSEHFIRSVSQNTAITDAELCVLVALDLLDKIRRGGDE